MPRDRRIIFAPANPKYRMTVFTDIDCGYCRKMHTQIAEYNKAGIAVEYLFFPRAGLNPSPSPRPSTSGARRDRRKALTDAKTDRPVPKKTCANPITMDYELGQQDRRGRHAGDLRRRRHPDRRLPARRRKCWSD